MKNLKYFPFERNRYFYGKLLSVDDFETEQRYMNDKRRMLNRFLYGTGVVCGMRIVEVDDFTISLEMGLALDFSGREIIVANPITKRLSSIDGFTKYCLGSQDRQFVYLCIAYDEKLKETVHNITKINDEQKEEYNKFEESYKLYITSEEPECENAHTTMLYEDTKTIYVGDGIRIRQRVPLYVESNTDFQVTIIVEKSEEVKKVDFSYDLILLYMEQGGEHTARIVFHEQEYEPQKRYEQTYSFHAMAVEGQTGVMEMVPESFTLTLEEVTKKERIQGKFQTQITKRSMEAVMIEDYYDVAMEDIIKNTYEQGIYLAKIDVIKAGDTYAIDSIENMPYQQYIWNHILAGTMENLRLKYERNEVKDGNPKKILEDMNAHTWNTMDTHKIRTGSAIIDLGIGGVQGQRFFSEEIIHGLGPGEVSITLGLTKGVKESNQIIYGNQNVFDDPACSRIELAAKLNMARGSFVIGIRCEERVEAKKIKIYFTVCKDTGIKKEEERIVELMVKPNILNISMRENHLFEALVDGVVQKNIQWSIKETDGGVIDENGYYTAPNQQGIYEIIAQSRMNKNLRATAFVLIR